MKFFLRILSISLFFYGSSHQTVTAQQVKKKRTANISINIQAPLKDSLRTSYFNVGLLTNINKLSGLGINAISSVVKTNLSGLQISGLANITGQNMNGFQLSGITNINGYNVNGLSMSGLINLIGNQAQGFLLAGGINISGKEMRGLMIGGLVNISGTHAKGLQIGGLANVTGEDVKGINIGGLMNVNARTLYGTQLASLININGKTAYGTQIAAIGNVGVKIKGLQLSALSNIAATELKGVQICGAVNTAMSTAHSAQISPLVNICLNRMGGAQVGIGNYATEVKGTQIGFLNLCSGEVKGVQIGIINHSKDTSTVKIGLVNVNPITHIQLLAFGGNSAKFNLGVRFQNKLTYTMLGFGSHYLDLNDKFSGTIFYRAGLYYPFLNRFQVSGDLGYFHIENFKNKDINTPERMYSLQARINVSYHPLKKFGIFVSGGYGITRYYNKNKMYEKKPIIEAGIILF